MKVRKRTACNSAETVVAYIYREMASAEIDAFEDHLAVCTECTDTFAELSFSRYSVYEWQQTEFAPMPTPRFVIPDIGSEAASLGWLATVKAAFAFAPRLAPAGAFAAVIAAAVFAFVSFGDDPIDTAADKIDPAPIVDTFEGARSAEPVIAETVSRDDNVLSNESEPVPQAVAASPAPVRSKRPVTKTRKHLRSYDREAALAVVPPVPETSAPRLNEFTEFSDTSLRLADLVADIDTDDR